MILTNIDKQLEKEIISNIIELEFDFDRRTMTIFYFIVEDEYPEVVLSFSEVKEIIM